MRELLRSWKQRAVVQWTIAYLAVAWLLLQLFSILSDQFGWPVVLERSATVLLAVGVVVVMIIAWYHGEEGRQRVRAIELIMLAIVALMAGAALKFTRKLPAEPVGFKEPSGRPVTAASPARASIAVLPFDNLSGEREDEYFSDGFTEEIIHVLANVPDLQVASRTSSFAFKNRDLAIEEIGRRLGVQKVLEGSLRRNGDRIRITAQLINVRDGFHIWSKVFDRASGDVLAVQDELARELVNSLDVAINPMAAGTLPTRDPEAYDLYLRGLYHSRRAPFASDSGIHYLELATRRDPRFATAFGALGQAYQARNFSVGNKTAEYREKAFIAIEKALALDPRQLEALVARGNMAYTIERGFNYEAAARDFRRAIEINPRFAPARHALGALYHHVGLNERALAEFRLATELDPQNNFGPFRVPRTLMYQGKFAEALTIIQAQPDLDRNWQWPLALWYNGKSAEALRAIEGQVHAVAEFTEDHHSVYALLLAGTGRNAEAETQIAKAVAKAGGSHFHHAAYNIASAYALMGKPKEAMTWLRRTAREGFPNYELFLRDPNLNNLRRDPEFNTFLEDQKRVFEHLASVL